MFRLLIFLWLGSSLMAETQCYDQWFTGPLLGPTPITVEMEHPGIEISYGPTHIYGIYNSKRDVIDTIDIWSWGPYVDYQFALGKRVAVEFLGAFSTSFSGDISCTHLLDTNVLIGYQIMAQEKDSWVPDLRLIFDQIFPTGVYDELDPKKDLADFSGLGSFQSGLELVYQKKFGKKHPFNLIASAGYFFSSRIKIDGVSYFGGSADTRGTVNPGSFFFGWLSCEYALSKTWALAFESNYLFGSNRHYKAKRGSPLDVRSFDEIVVALEVEHTFSKTPALSEVTGELLRGEISSLLMVISLPIFTFFKKEDKWADAHLSICSMSIKLSCSCCCTHVSSSIQERMCTEARKSFLCKFCIPQLHNTQELDGSKFQYNIVEHTDNVELGNTVEPNGSKFSCKEFVLQHICMCCNNMAYNERIYNNSHQCAGHKLDRKVVRMVVLLVVHKNHLRSLEHSRSVL